MNLDWLLDTLHDFGIHHRYMINEDGSINVLGDVDLRNKKLEEIPFDFNLISGTFNCSGNLLTSLKGCPKYVGGSFLCGENKLTSLEFGPKFVGVDYVCSNNNLTNLIGSPRVVNGQFNCVNSGLLSIEGAPELIKRSFCISNNKIETLGKLPKINGQVHYENNPFLDKEKFKAV